MRLKITGRVEFSSQRWGCICDNHWDFFFFGLRVKIFQNPFSLSGCRILWRGSSRVPSPSSKSSAFLGRNAPHNGIITSVAVQFDLCHAVSNRESTCNDNKFVFNTHVELSFYEPHHRNGNNNWLLALNLKPLTTATNAIMRRTITLLRGRVSHRSGFWDVGQV